MYLVTMKLKDGDEALYVAEGKTGDIAIVRARRALKQSAQKSDVTDISARDLGGTACAMSDLMALAYPGWVLTPQGIETSENEEER